MTVTPYLSFHGNCAEAMRSYHECLGGGGSLDIKMQEETSPEEGAAPAMLGKVLHAHLAVEEATIMGSDIPYERYTALPPPWCLAR